MAVVFALVSFLVGYASADSAKVDRCSVSGDPHFHTFDGADYDYQGTGVYTVARNSFVDVQIALEQCAASYDGRAFVRATSVRILGSQTCRACKDGDPNYLEVTFVSYGVDQPKPSEVIIDYRNSATPALSTRAVLPAVSPTVPDAIRKGMTASGVVFSVGPADQGSALTLQVFLEHSPSDVSNAMSFMVSLGHGMFVMSTLADYSGLAGGSLTGLCGRYSRMVADDFTKADGTLAFRADGQIRFVNNADINAFAASFATPQAAIRIEMPPALLVPSKAQDDLDNKMIFQKLSLVSLATSTCDAFQPTVPVPAIGIEQCVYDFALTQSSAISASNVYSLVAAAGHNMFLQTTVPAPTPNIVSHRNSTQAWEIIGGVLVGLLGLAIFIGVLANRRLRKSNSQQLIVVQDQKGKNIADNI